MNDVRNEENKRSGIKFDSLMKRLIDTKVADKWSPEHLNDYC